MPKVKKIKSMNHSHEPLGQVIIDETYQKKYAIAKKEYQDSHRNDDNDDDDDNEMTNKNNKKKNSFLDEKSSQKIMELSKVQQLEIEAEEQRNDMKERKQQDNNRKLQKKMDSDDEDEDDDDDDDDDDNNDNDSYDDDLVQHTKEGYVTLSDNMLGLSAEEEALVSSMMNLSSERKTLADIILEKIEQKKEQQLAQQQLGDDDDQMNNDNQNDDDTNMIPQKVIDVYTDIGKVLSHYTSGKLPKAFKVIPSLSNWEEILYLTRPDNWTPIAMYMATRIFASNLNPKMATKFYTLILLDAVRHDINMNKKLNYHYYMSLKKAIYKPTAFFRGIIIPLVKDPNCTLREAAIISSVLQRVSIPVHHSAVAIHKLASIESGNYNGVTSIFIKTLLNKKYSLPTPVIQSLINHFTSFLQQQPSLSDANVLPVLWHQALLVFVQRYKYEIQSNDYNKELLKKLMKQHYHHKITPEIRRELFGNVQAYKDEQSQQMSMSVDNSQNQQQQGSSIETTNIDEMKT